MLYFFLLQQFVFGPLSIGKGQIHTGTNLGQILSNQ